MVFEILDEIRQLWVKFPKINRISRQIDTVGRISRTVEGGEGAVGVAIHCISIIPATPGSPGDTPEWIKPVGTGWVRPPKNGSLFVSPVTKSLSL